MARWECIVCGLIYDEREGWPDDGIAPGTRWEDVPEDWLCPDCGVGKADFELLPGSEDDEMPAADANDQPAMAEHVADAGHRVVIVGSGLAGYGLAREIRKHSDDTDITLITADGGEVYSKPLLSTGYTKQLSVEKLAIQSADQIAEQLSLNVKTRTRVASVDAAAKCVTTESGEQISYDDLVLALGAEVIRPPMGGDAADDVYSVNDLDDYARFQAAVTERNVKKVAIIGAGLIGCEFTNDLLNGGYQTESVDPMGWCLPTLLPEACGRAVQSALENMGAQFHFGPLATEVNRLGEGYRVSLNNGSHIDADIVLSAIGVRPRTELAQASGLDCGRGIKADRFLRTSDPNIYTLGDCAEVEGNVLVYVAPLSAAARALGATLTGTETAVVYPGMPVGIKTPACPVNVAAVPRDAEGDWHIEGDAPDLKATFRSPDGQLLGFALTGTMVKEKMALGKELPAILD